MIPVGRFQTITLALLLLAGVDLVPTAYGHALQPGFLELRQLDDDRYGVLWKKPAVAGSPMAIEANLPEHCSPRLA